MLSRFIRGRITELTPLVSGAPDYAAHVHGVMLAPASDCQGIMQPAVSWVPVSVVLSAWAERPH